MRIITVMAALIAISIGSFPASGDLESGYIVAHDGAKIFYQVVGNGAQKVIIPGGLFLHPDFDELARGRTLVYYDMRDRGRSSRVDDEKSITIEDDLRDLESIRAHFGFEKTSLIGYSYLGMMVILYAKEHPDRVERIVQLSPVSLDPHREYPANLRNDDQAAVIDPNDSAQLQEWRKNGWDKSKPKEFCEKDWLVSRRQLVGNAAYAEKLQSRCQYENEWPINFERHLQAHFGSILKLNVPADEVRKKVTQPVLTIHGTLDRNAPYGAGREWNLILSNAKLITVPGGAHQVWIDEPRAVRWVGEFLSGKWPKRAEKISKLEVDSKPS